MSLLTRLRARYHYWLGLAHRSRGNRALAESAYHDAIGEFTQAILLDPRLTGAHFARGVVYWRELNDYERAIRDFSRVIELDPAIADAHLNRGLARVFGRLDTREDAVTDFEEYLRRGKNGYWRIEAENQLARLRAAR
ncbi:MAG: tetratricopeptide repeat protein [Chloroflexi bacterium]|nr:tetratricopeptide repeat protein [Chloroflexota bacterium]